MTWLGDVPVEWELRPLKYLCSFSGGGTPSKEVTRYWVDGVIPWVSPKDMKSPRIVDTVDRITEEAVVESSVGFVEPGSVLMVVRSGILQHSIPVAISDVRVTLNQDMKALRFQHPSVAEYFFYLVQGHNRELLARWLKEGATVESIEQDYLANESFPDIDPEEFAQIVRYLDYETAKIDRLIEKQQQLIALLKEKRQAVISHAVTKGLNPNAPMKDSGVEWLGQVPAHWDVCRINKVATKITNGYVGPTRDIFVDEGVKYLQSLHIKDNAVRFEPPYYVREKWSQEKAKSVLSAGDVVIVQTGDIGQSACIPRELEGANCHALIVVSSVRSVLHGEYLAWCLNTDFGVHSLKSIQTGALHPHLNCGNVRYLSIPVPSLEEQTQIVEFVEARRDWFLKLVQLAEEQVLLLKERRTALISAAVTGKIDVRDWTPPADEDLVAA